MNDLLRELAPISEAGWAEIEAETRRTLKATLAARRLFDFTGPHGWDSSAVNLGHTELLANAPADGVTAKVRHVQPLVELRVPFALSRTELESVGRGARDADVGTAHQAAFRIAIAEDRAVFHGYAAAGIHGVCEVSSHDRLTLSDDYTAYHNVVAEAVHMLTTTGIGGPYAIALGPRCYDGLTKTMSEAGFPVIEYVRRLVDGPIVPAMGLDGAAVVSLRGGDFELVVGQDFSLGYLDHSATEVRLYIQESFTFRALSPDAVVALAYDRQAGRAKSE